MPYNPTTNTGPWSNPYLTVPGNGTTTTTGPWSRTMPPLTRYNNMLQVMGVDSAREFQIGPNSQVLLMDSNRPVFYVKKSDDSGYSEIKAYEFHEIPLDPMPEPKAEENRKAEEAKTKPDPAYVTKKDFDDFKKMIEELVMKDG